MVGKWIESNYYEAYRITWYHLIHHPESQKFAHSSKLGAIMSHCNSPACLQSMTHLRTIYQLHHIRMYPVTVWAMSVSLVCVELLSVCDVCVLYFATLGEKTHILDALKWFQDVSSVFRYPCRLWWSCMNQLKQQKHSQVPGAILGSSLSHRAFFTSRYMGPQK